MASILSRPQCVKQSNALLSGGLREIIAQRQPNEAKNIRVKVANFKN